MSSTIKKLAAVKTLDTSTNATERGTFNKDQRGTFNKGMTGTVDLIELIPTKKNAPRTNSGDFIAFLPIPELPRG
jgi:hypothetical protein